MIFTIGHTESYKQYLSKQEKCMKLGRTENYRGGSVWQTKEEAEKFCPVDYSVYGLKADWNKDTEPNPNNCWSDLLYDREIVDLNTDKL